MKSIATFLFALFFGIVVNAQEQSSFEIPWTFGLSWGVNHTNIIAPQSLQGVGEINNKTGFQLGVLSKYQVTKRFSIDPKMDISFNQGQIVLSNMEGSQSQYDVLPISANVMTHFTFKKSEGRMKPYFFAGPNFKLPIAQQPKESTAFSSSYDLAIDFGIGIEKSFSKFNFSPELRYSYGLLNVNQNPQIESLNFHQISLVFNVLGKRK